jgi:TPR repeat protein
MKSNSCTRINGRARARALLLGAAALGLAMQAGPSYAGYSEGAAAFDKQDYSSALAQWRPLADAGDPAAQFSLGWMYLNGRGLRQDDTLAFQWIRLSAQQGLARAQSKLGWMSERAVAIWAVLMVVVGTALGGMLTFIAARDGGL